MRKYGRTGLLVFVCCLLISLWGCRSGGDFFSDVKSDDFYQYSVFRAFVNRIFDGNMTSIGLCLHGDTGLGCFNGLDGELIMLDGDVFRVDERGTVHVADDEEKICFANVTWFDADGSLLLRQPVDYRGLRSFLENNIPSANTFCAFKISGTFHRVTCGSIQKQEKPYTRELDEIIPERPVFERGNVEGTLVGFYCPEFIGHINVAGYHFHFLSNDRGFGGHVIDFRSDKLRIEMDYIQGFRFELPDTDEFMEGSFDKVFDYGNK